MFNIKVPVPSAREAFDMLAFQILSLEWFKKNNRMGRWKYYENLNHPLINAMIEDRNRDETTFTRKYLERFTSELYKKELYAERISLIEQEISKVQACYERFENLKKSWGFEILPEYHVDINLYGMGGSYNRDENNVGHIITGQTKNLAVTIGHEMIHLGIEYLIINPKHEAQAPIKQEEKERIVDNLCIYAMNGILPLERVWKDGKKSPYQEVAAGAAYMDKVVGKQPQNNLVIAVQKFLERE